MEGTPLEQLMSKGNFVISCPESVLDFFTYKNSPNFSLNSIPLPNPRKRIFILKNVSLEQISDKIYNINSKREGRYARAYSVKDKTGEFFLLWATRDSMLPVAYSCDRFEMEKELRGNTPKEVLIFGTENRENYYIFNIKF